MSGFRDIADGESVEIQGSAERPYVVRNQDGVYSCTCPAWRNQSRPIEARTCKHLRHIRGDQAEAARVGDAAAAPRATASSVEGAPVLLAHAWKPHVDLTGWWLSEKLDGVRAYWDGSDLMSRLGNRFATPAWFTASLGAAPLDGELWTGRGEFQRTVGIVRRGDRSPSWRDVKLLVFDAPGLDAPFETRIAALRERLASAPDHVVVVDHARCEGGEHLQRELDRVEQLGGEGLMARKPGSRYVVGRSHTLLKIKSFEDIDARVVGHTAGAGRHRGRLGALEVQLASGVRCSVGTGLSDAQREAPPPIGSIVIVRFQELTRDGVPRFPVFAGVRHDVTWPAAPATAPPSTTRRSTTRQSTTRQSTTRQSTTRRPAPKDTDTMGDYFELSDGKSHKFWEISVDGATHTVRYGRIGTDGTSKTKELASEAAARADADKLIAAKTKKGYTRASGASDAGPAPSVQPSKSQPKAKTKAKPAAAAAAPAGGAAGAPVPEGRRYFELSDGKSHKFWEIVVRGAAYTVRYGRIGTSGTSKTKELGDAAKAAVAASKLVAEKVGKGYAEVAAPETAAGDED